MTPNGSPSTKPAGTASEAMSSRFAKFVYRPIRLFAPIGSAATSSRVGCHVVVGVSRASVPSRAARPAAPKASSRSRSRKSSDGGAVVRRRARSWRPTGRGRCRSGRGAPRCGRRRPRTARRRTRRRRAATRPRAGGRCRPRRSRRRSAREPVDAPRRTPRPSRGRAPRAATAVGIAMRGTRGQVGDAARSGARASGSTPSGPAISSAAVRARPSVAGEHGDAVDATGRRARRRSSARGRASA